MNAEVHCINKYRFHLQMRKSLYPLSLEFLLRSKDNRFGSYPITCGILYSYTAQNAWDLVQFQSYIARKGSYQYASQSTLFSI